MLNIRNKQLSKPSPFAWCKAKVVSNLRRANDDCHINTFQLKNMVSLWKKGKRYYYIF